MPGSKDSVTVLIVDDEKEACINLKNILSDYIDGGIVVTGMAHNTREAEKLTAKLLPDAVFLDIEMPNENAFEFLQRVGPVPYEVIFVTAYDEYALRAFKLNAVDYILKPISIRELTQAIEKLKGKIKVKRTLGGMSDPAFSVVSEMIANKSRGHKITLRDNNIIEVVDFKDIYFVEAQGSYVRVIFLKEGQVKEVVMSGTLTDYEELLPSDMFFRTHKSYVINCAHVKSVLKNDNAEVIIAGEHRLPVSRRRYQSLVEFLKVNQFRNE